MEIPKYLYPEWLTRIMDSGGDETKLRDVFPDGTILKLKNLETNEEKEYTANGCSQVPHTSRVMKS